MSYAANIPQLGPPGPQGATIILVAGLPGPEDGANGDWAIQFGPGDDTTIYGPKAAGVWPAGRSIRGKIGLPGPPGQSIQGNPGPPGPPGGEGPAGYRGWAPVMVAVDDGAGNSVLQLADWVGGQGPKPDFIGRYVGAGGLVEAIGEATVLPAASAGSTSYDNTVSGLVANTVQAAIDLVHSLMVKLSGGQTLTGGFDVDEAYDHGTIVAAVTVTPHLRTKPIHKLVYDTTETLTVAASDQIGPVTLQIVMGASASGGSIVLSGFDAEKGDDITYGDGDVFWLHIMNSGTKKRCHVEALP